MIGPRHQYPPGTLLAAFRDLDLARLELVDAVRASIGLMLRRHV